MARFHWRRMVYIYILAAVYIFACMYRHSLFMERNQGIIPCIGVHKRQRTWMGCRANRAKNKANELVHPLPLCLAPISTVLRTLQEQTFHGDDALGAHTWRSKHWTHVAINMCCTILRLDRSQLELLLHASLLIDLFLACQGLQEDVLEEDIGNCNSIVMTGLFLAFLSTSFPFNIFCWKKCVQAEDS